MLNLYNRQSCILVLKEKKMLDDMTGKQLDVYQLLGSGTSRHSNRVNSVVWSPDSTRLASASNDNTIRIWDVSNGYLIMPLIGHTNWVNSVAWSPDGTHIASASSDKTVRIWQAV